MRRRDRLLLRLDLLPAGFRRRRIDGQLRRDWECRRMRRVWWAPIGRRALANGFDYRSVGGGFYVLGGQTLSRIGQQGFIDWFDELRFRFVSSEEDLMITLMTCACNNPVYELRDANPDWGRLTVNRVEEINSLLARRQFVLHPIKDQAFRDSLNEEVDRR